MISIIIPVYNCEKYVSDCLDSCLTQDISHDEYEILCIDDCSSDGSLAILYEYERKNQNIRVFHQKTNQGVSAARNVGIEHMKSEYCWFIDGDDFIAENCLAKIVENLKSDILSVGQATFRENGGSRARNIANSTYHGMTRERYITNRIIRSSLIDGLRFQTNVAYGEDELLFFEIMQRRPRCLELNEAIYYYRLHSQSAMSLKNAKKQERIDSVANSARYLLDHYSPYSNETIAFIKGRVDLAFSEIASMNVFRRMQKMNQLKKMGLINLNLEDTNIGMISSYRNKRKQIRKQKIISFLSNIKPLVYIYRKCFKRR